MTPQMNAALGGARVLIAGLLRIELHDHVIRLCDGSAAITWDAEVYSGRDPVYGTIGSVEAITEATGDTIPGLDLSLLPPALPAAVHLCAPANQGAPVRLWLASVNYDTGVVVPSPELIFAGELDAAALVQDRAELAVEIAVASVFERLFEPDEGARLADSFHQDIWPGELGFANMTGTPVNKLWGPGEKPPSVSYIPQGGGGGGFGDGRNYEQLL